MVQWSGLWFLRKRTSQREDIGYKNNAKVNNIVNDYEECDKDGTFPSDSILECIIHFWTGEWLDLICKQSKIYVHQKSLEVIA